MNSAEAFPCVSSRVNLLQACKLQLHTSSIGITPAWLYTLQYPKVWCISKHWRKKFHGRKNNEVSFFCYSKASSYVARANIARSFVNGKTMKLPSLMTPKLP